jgi:hypothetical protein
MVEVLRNQIGWQYAGMEQLREQPWHVCTHSFVTYSEKPVDRVRFLLHQWAHHCQAFYIDFIEPRPDDKYRVTFFMY